jgi:uncharacterized RDD family membrane protein YckC
MVYRTSFAPIWRRMLAFLIDSALCLLIMYFLLQLTAINDAFIFMASFLLAIFIFWIYFIPLEAVYGQTLGKKLLGIKIIKVNGERIGWSASFLRNVLRIVDILPFFYIVGLISILLTGKKQRIGDLAAQTIVVNA